MSNEQTTRDHKRDNVQDGRVKIAVFDFDGTCIEGNSPVILVKHLSSRRMLDKRELMHIISWALRYKFHLPQTEHKVRRRVFSAFKGKPVEAVDAYLAAFYYDKIKPLWREEAIEQINRLRNEGFVIIAVSATFEPIVRCAQNDGLFDYQVSTVMHATPDGCYTDEVKGKPIEGEEKVLAIKRLADEQFGEGEWELTYCFADHYSDIDVLSSAVNPVAVTPDSTLRRCAKRRGWAIVQWGGDTDADRR